MSGKISGIIGTIVAVAVPATGAIWYLATQITTLQSRVTQLEIHSHAFDGINAHVEQLDGRVRAVETQVHTLTVAPTLAATGARSAANAKTEVPNPIAEDCAHLVQEAMGEATSETWEGGNLLDDAQLKATERQALETMKQLGCSASSGR